jgi:hypothetical protein
VQKHAFVWFENLLTPCSFGWWLMTGADLFWEKNTANRLLVAGLLWEKSTVGRWLISQANRAFWLRTCKIPPQPGSRGTQETTISTQPGLHGAGS